MPDPDYTPTQGKNCENKQGGDTTSPHLSKKGSLDLKPRFIKQTNASMKRCENCLAMILIHDALHNRICNNFKMSSNGLFVCKICSDTCSMSRKYYHLKMKHKHTLESNDIQNNQVMKEYYQLKMPSWHR